MPSRRNLTNKEYIQILDELHEILEKFTSLHAIFLCGDFNDSLSERQVNEREKLPNNFCNSHKLVNLQNASPTLYHVYQKDKADIFCNTTASGLITSV